MCGIWNEDDAGGSISALHLLALPEMDARRKVQERCLPLVIKLSHHQTRLLVAIAGRWNRTSETLGASRLSAMLSPVVSGDALQDSSGLTLANDLKVTYDA